MGKIYFSKNIGSDAVKYRDGLWIPYRKRNYVYWYNFLQHAERSSHHKVNWNKYKGWGGANYVLGTKFNDFWEEKWKELFGLKNKNDEQKYPFRIQPKTDGIRLSLLCWEQRSKLKDPNKKGQVIEIARKVYQYETGLSGEKRPRYYQGEFDVSQINPDSNNVRVYLSYSVSIEEPNSNFDYIGEKFSKINDRKAVPLGW